jgi:hypothetical protein
MYRKQFINKMLFYIFIASIIVFGGSSSYRYIWNKASEKIDSGLKRSMQTTANNSQISVSSTRSSSVSSQPVLPIDICIHPRELDLNSKGKMIISWIQLPEAYDSYEIADQSLGLSIAPCPKCETIYPTCQSPKHRQYLSVFPRQDLIDKIERMNLDLPAKLNLIIYGELSDGTPFEGSETIMITKQKK